MYFLGFTAILLILIWFLQIFFLNNYYEEMKIRRTQESANQLVQLYQADNRDGFTTLANQITEDNDVYVRLDAGDKMLYPSIETLAYGNEIADARNGLKTAAGNGKDSYTFTEVNELNQKRTYVFATYLDDNNYTGMGLSKLYTEGNRTKLAGSFVILDYLQTTKTTITAKTIAPSCGGGYVAVWQDDDQITVNNDFVYCPYFVTPDGVEVYGITTRTVYTMNCAVNPSLVLNEAGEYIYFADVKKS